MKAKAYIVHRAMCEPELEWRKPKDCLSAEPLYSKREWQGLTDEEVRESIDPFDEPFSQRSFFYFAEVIEAKLKEKNHG